MQHFANFNIRAGLDAVQKVGAKVAGLNSVKIGAGLGAAAGLAKGAGVGESEEEKSNTTALGRVGKLVGNTAVGGTVGGAIGLAAGDVAKGVKRQYKKSEIELSPPKMSNNSYGYNPNANFAFANPFPAMLNKAQPYLNNAKAAGGALKDTAQAFGATRGVQIGTGLGAAAGLARGAGIGETEEERANTTGLGRLGKVIGNTTAGGVVGGSLGLAGENAARVSNQMYKRRKTYQAMDDLA